MITIKDVIEFFEQDSTDPWSFNNTKEAASVVRAQHEEIDKLKKEAEIYRAELIDKAFRHVDRVKELQEEIERLRAANKDLQAWFDDLKSVFDKTRDQRDRAFGLLERLNMKLGEPK